jgi:quinoprotein relay system zinc metallohydrolase 2
MARLLPDPSRWRGRLPLLAVLALVLWLGAAAAAPVPLATTEIAPGVFVHRGALEDFTAANAGGIANLGFVIGRDAVAVVDSGGSRQEGEALLAAIRAKTDLPIRYVIDTHMHPDHCFGNAAFVADGTVFVGHARLPAAMRRSGPYFLANMRRLLGAAFAGTELVLPTLLVEDRTTLDLGGRRLDLQAWPTAHTDNDLTVLDETTATLFAGDLVFLDRLPVVDGNLSGWLGVMDPLVSLPARRVVSGHGPPTAPWPDALAPERRYLTKLEADVRAALKAGRTIEQAAETVAPDSRDHWLMAPEIHPRNVISSYKELEWE